MSLEILGIRDLSLEEWDRVSGGGDAGSPTVNAVTLTTAEAANTTVSIVPCDFKDLGGNIGFTNTNVCWFLQDNTTGEGNVLPSNSTLAYDDGEGTFAGGDPNYML